MKIFSRKSFAVVWIVGLALAVYGEVLSYYFTDVDTFSLINSGRFEGGRGIHRILTSELMAGRMINAIYYRPLTSLIYGFEYLAFGLSPKGYHAIDIVLFAATAFLLVLISRQFWNKERGSVIGLMAATIFLLHPVQIDNVPAIARMGDLLAGFLATLSWAGFTYFFLAERKTFAHRLSYAVSILAAFLGLTAKEPAIVGSAAITFTLLLFSREMNVLRRSREFVMLIFPYAVSTLVFLLCRTKILGGLGGYVSKRGVFSDPTVLLFDFRFKTTVLGHLAGLLTPSLSDNFDAAAYFFMTHGLILKILVGLFFAFLGWKAFKHWRLLLTVGFHRNEDPSVTDRRMTWLLTATFLSHALLLFFTILMLRYLYLSTISFSLLLALFGFRLFEQIRRQRRVTRPQACGLLVLVMLAGLIFAHCPLWNKERLRRWKIGGQIAEHLLEDLEARVQETPDRRLYLFNVPYSLTYGKTAAVIWELPFNQILLEHAIRDYLELKHLATPQKPWSDILVLNYLYVQDPYDLRLTTVFTAPDTIAVEVQHGAIPSPFPWSRIPGRWDQEHLFATHGGKINFEPEPKEGWPRSMTVQLLPGSMTKPAPRFFTYTLEGLQEFSPAK